MRKEFDSELFSVNAWLELTTKTSKNVLPCTQQALLANLTELDVSLIFYLYSTHKDEVHVQLEPVYNNSLGPRILPCYIDTLCMLGLKNNTIQRSGMVK